MVEEGREMAPTTVDSAVSMPWELLDDDDDIEALGHHRAAYTI